MRQKFERVIVFDFDNTLCNQDSLGDEVRPLYYPEFTAQLFKKLKAQGAYIIVSSSQTEQNVLLASLKNAGIDIDENESLEILGKAQTRALSYDGNGSAKKVAHGLARKAEFNAKCVVVVEDDLSVDSSNKDLIHILVPLQDEPNSNIPYNKNYLSTTLLPTEILQNVIKPLVRSVIASDEQNKVDPVMMTNYLNGIDKELFLKENVIHKLEAYKLKRASNPNEYYHIWSRFFGSTDAHSRTKKLEAVEVLLEKLKSGTTLDENDLPQAAKNGELSSIISPMKK